MCCTFGLLSCLAQVGELASALRSSREEVAAQVAAAIAKDRENSQLWEQVLSMLSQSYSA